MWSVKRAMTTMLYTAAALTTFTCVSVFGAVTLNGPTVIRTNVKNGTIRLECAFKVTANEEVTQLTWLRQFSYDKHFKVIIQVPIPLLDGQKPYFRDYDLKRRTNITIGEMVNWETLVYTYIKPSCRDEAMYRCDVNVMGGVAPSPLDVRVVLLEPPTAISLNQNHAVPENQETIFRCSAAVGKPEANIGWVMVRRVANQLENITMGGMVTKRMDSNYCSPLAESTLTKEVTSNDEIIRCLIYRGRDVVYLEQPVLVLYSTRNTKIRTMVNGNKMADWISSLSVDEGDNVVLNCSSRGNPQPRYTWLYSTGKGGDSGHWMETDGSSVITLSNVTINQTGTYQCVATNTVGGERQTHETKMKVIIKDRPTYPTATPSPKPQPTGFNKIVAYVGSTAIVVGLVVLTVCGKCFGK